MKPPAILLSALLLMAAPAAADCPDIEWLTGSWHGALERSGREMELVFHFYSDTAACIRGEFDIPHNQRSGIPLNSVTVDGHSVRLRSNDFQFVYSGEREGASLVGTFTLGWQQMELVLDRLEGE